MDKSIMKLLERKSLERQKFFQKMMKNNNFNLDFLIPDKMKGRMTRREKIQWILGSEVNGKGFIK